MKLFHLGFGLVLALGSAVTFAQAVNINTASAEQLDKAIKGIGPARAAAIVHYREVNGPFKSVDDLLKVQWIKDKALEKLLADNKEMLTVSGETTVPAVHMATPKVPATPAVPAMPAATIPAAPAVPTMPATPVTPAK